MAKVTFADLQVYTTLEVEATMPDGEVLVFEHRRPTVAEVRAMKKGYPARPALKEKEFLPFKDGMQRVYDLHDPNWIRSVNEWSEEVSLHQIALTWGENIPGGDTNAKVDELRALPTLLVQALARGAEMAIDLSEDAVKDRSFRGD